MNVNCWVDLTCSNKQDKLVLSTCVLFTQFFKKLLRELKIITFFRLTLHFERLSPTQNLCTTKIPTGVGWTFCSGPTRTSIVSGWLYRVAIDQKFIFYVSWLWRQGTNILPRFYSRCGIWGFSAQSVLWSAVSFLDGVPLAKRYTVLMDSGRWSGIRKEVDQLTCIYFNRTWEVSYYNCDTIIRKNLISTSIFIIANWCN